MRLFIGTLLGVSNQRALAGFTGTLVQAHPDALRSVPDGTVHITHVFCPDVAEAMFGPLCDAVGDATRHRDRFDVTLGPPHVIVGGSKPRLLVSPVLQGAQEQTALMKAIVDAISKHCPGLAMSPSKSPHVTLGRFRKQSRRSDGRAVMQTIDDGKVVFGTSKDRIECVEVIESTLTSKGPEYATRRRMDLGRP